MFEALHHGAVNGVTGSCFQLLLVSGASVLIDCEIFQTDEQGLSVSIAPSNKLVQNKSIFL